MRNRENLTDEQWRNVRQRTLRTLVKFAEIEPDAFFHKSAISLRIYNDGSAVDYGTVVANDVPVIMEDLIERGLVLEGLIASTPPGDFEEEMKLRSSQKFKRGYKTNLEKKDEIKAYFNREAWEKFEETNTYIVGWIVLKFYPILLVWHI